MSSCKSRKIYLFSSLIEISYPCFIVGSIYAATPRTQRGLPVVLGGDPKGKNFLYANGNSVIIRDINVSSCVYQPESSLPMLAPLIPESGDFRCLYGTLDHCQLRQVFPQRILHRLGRCVRRMCLSCSYIFHHRKTEDVPFFLLYVSGGKRGANTFFLPLFRKSAFQHLK